MALAAVTDIEEFTGFKYDDFLDEGVDMTNAAFDTWVGMLIDAASARIYNHCNVESLEQTTYTDEYHDGRGPTVDGGYGEYDRYVWLNNVPVISITSIAENTAGVASVPSWTTRTKQTDSVAGDYLLYDLGVGIVRFHDNVPDDDIRNVKVTYVGGFASTANEIDQLKVIVCKLVSNILVRKKQIQEKRAIQQIGTPDYEEKYDQVIYPEVEILKELNQFVRPARPMFQ